MANVPALPTRPYPLGGIATTSINITSIANTSGTPIVITATAHGLPVGKNVYARIAGVTGQTAINAGWQLFVNDANTVTIVGLPNWTGGAVLQGNGVASGSGTIVMSPVPLTINRPELYGLGILVHSLMFDLPAGNSGTNVYIGIILPPSRANQIVNPNGSFMSKSSPYTDCLMIMQKTDIGPRSLPSISYTASNALPIDDIYVDFDTAGDVVLVSAHQI